MRLAKFIALLVWCCPLFVFASTTFEVPFYNVTVQAGTKMNVNYKFDPSHQMLVCTSSSFNSSILSWNYKGAEYSAVLPPGGHISLKDNQYPEGFFADNSGSLGIDNSNSSISPLLVSCEYHTWG